jgi:hypothetical protein
MKVNVPSEALAVMFNDVPYGPIAAWHDVMFYLYKNGTTGLVSLYYHIGYERSSFSVSTLRAPSNVGSFTNIVNDTLYTISIARVSDTTITLTINGSPSNFTVTSSDAIKLSSPRGRSICLGIPDTSVIDAAVPFPSNPTNVVTVTFDDVALTLNSTSGVGSVAYRFRVDTFTDVTSAKSAITVQDPLANSVVLLMRFDDNLHDELCHPFAADGSLSYITDWVGGRAVKLNGATTGNGGSNVIYSVSPSLDWALQDDYCIEVVGRINSNINQPRIFIRLAQGVDDIAQIYADAGGTLQLSASVVTGASAITQLEGPEYVYGSVYHLCLQRIGNETKFYVNGQQFGITVTSAYRPPNAPTSVFIGNNSRAFIDAMDGDIGWTRVTNGIRYTGPFIPPIEPHAEFPPCGI